MVRAIEGALRVDREARISKVSDLMSVWCTDNDGQQVPISMGTIKEGGVDDERPMGDVLGSTQPKAYQDFAFEQTKDSYDEASIIGADLPLSQEITVSPHVEMEQSSSRRVWYIAGLVLCVLAGYFVTQMGIISTPSKNTSQVMAKLRHRPNQHRRRTRKPH